MGIEKIFLHERTVDILLRILQAEENGEKIYPLQISRDVGSPYSYVSKVLSDFEDNWIIETWFEGKMRVIRLSEAGRRIATMFRNLKNELKRDFKAMKKLKILENVLESHERSFEILAPVMAELNLLKSSTEDEKILKRIRELEEEISRFLISEMRVEGVEEQGV